MVPKFARCAAVVWLAALLVLASGSGVLAQDAKSDWELANLLKQARDLQRAAKFDDALATANRAVALAERVYGRDHPAVGMPLLSVAQALRSKSRNPEAEQLVRRAVAILEKAAAPYQIDFAKALGDLGNAHNGRGEAADAEKLYQRSLAILEAERGPNDPEVAGALTRLGNFRREQGRFDEAERLLKRSLEMRQRGDGTDQSDLAEALNNLAAVHHVRGQFAEAEPLYRQSLAIREKVLGLDHPNVAGTLNNLALLLDAMGRFAEAEPLMKRALAIRETVFGIESPSVAGTLNDLAGLYQSQRRFNDAEPLFTRALAIREKTLPADHPEVAWALNNAALAYQLLKRHEEAEPLYMRGLAIREKIYGPDHPLVAQTLNNLASLYEAMKRYDDAEPLYRRSIAIREKTLGPDHPLVASTLNNFALLYQSQGRIADAEALLLRSLAIRERAYGRDHPDVARSLNNLGTLQFEQGNWGRAAEYMTRSTDILVRRAIRGSADPASVRASAQKSETERSNGQFRSLAIVVHKLVESGSSDPRALTRQAFQTAQWALDSDTSRTVALMAARGAASNAALGDVVRQRQDLVAEWQKRDGLVAAAASAPAQNRNRESEAANRTRLAEIDTQIAVLDQRIAREFPSYGALAAPQPLSIEQVQALLGADEALVLFLPTFVRVGPTPEETLVWVVTKTDMRWVSSELGEKGLEREVDAIRCGLDATAWAGPRCPELTGKSYAPGDLATGRAPPFDHARAYRLYQSLFGRVRDLIRGKHLLVVPAGALTRLPLYALVTVPPGTKSDHRQIHWLARDNAITVLPAVASLDALRRVSRPSVATKPMIGFGNPLLDGPDASHSARARLARDTVACNTGVVLASTETRKVRGAAKPDLRGTADVALLRRQPPLPETADELCAVARDLGADVREIRLGERASEREVKALSASGQLSQYRIVHFATHGVLAGELDGFSEPGLIMTPPAVATADDDGYLTAGEIAGLKLDAELVILSACNTAAGGGQNEAALSGLARAFIYAQARALLVSHWEVDSDATVKLITATARNIAAASRAKNGRSVGRSEALRQAVLALIDRGRPHEAHPAYWAPFVLVGDGGGALR